MVVVASGAAAVVEAEVDEDVLLVLVEDELDVDDVIADELVEVVVDSPELVDDETDIEVEDGAVVLVKLVEKVLDWKEDEVEVLPPIGPTLPFSELEEVLEEVLDVLRESDADEVD